MTGKTPTACALLVAAISKSLAADAESLLQRMPSSFSGTYVWEHSGETWHAALTFTSRYTGENGDAIFEGTVNIRGQDRVTSFGTRVRAVVNSQTLAFEMAEINGHSKPGFPPRVYTGKIAPDLNTISARTGSSGKNLAVHLTAR